MSDKKKGDEVLRRLLNTPPKSDVNPSLTKPSAEKKPGDTPAKKRRPEAKQR